MIYLIYSCVKVFFEKNIQKSFYKCFVQFISFGNYNLQMLLDYIYDYYIKNLLF